MTTGAASFTELCKRCFGSGDSEAWTELVNRLQPKFARIAYRTSVEWGRTDRRDIDDVVQETFLKLGTLDRAKLQRVPLDSDSATLAYFQVMAANAAQDYFRAKYAAKRGEHQTEAPGERLEDFALGAGTLGETERQILLREIDGVLAAVPRERVAFWLYYRHGLTAKEIAAMPAFELTTKGVESLLFRLIARVRQTIRTEPPSDAGKGKVSSEPLKHE
jgi:RNA polymerase sigma factor (sigma-70 family)